MITAKRLARYEDLFGLSDNVRDAFIAGEFRTHSRSALSPSLLSLFPSPGYGWTELEPGR
ncbi:hypothetical protein A6M27_03010 [Acidithiobacillus thiooxidans]|uniref:Uncharacterized protein n=1 Tax=Acidithiobacillus thiooxidans TaxID=930 RepID=A0A1C2I990_ACITH|nr:hypothetical protein A6O24_13880 [Acidithiobacillus thiooxidans]OCX76208.1 hypothetical protein A6P07_02635 [Acidithiobacillus thiooxidans]OCX84941.1 hypothetical protein A6O26_03050 [Acidithiobacillus thiooxidans]OCX89320.1 hypothetical protein A6M27_03010 [Acidithiobacillus thiooxidans]OFC40840.1 hypothetical protein BAE47_19275 [Acidithiobacillus thiooxidans]